MLESLRTLGLTEAELSAELGVDKRTVFRWIEDHPTHIAKLAIGALVSLKAAGLPWRRKDLLP
jgi:hypothetical protein